MAADGSGHRYRRWPARVAAVPAGALLALAFPEAGAWWLAFVGLVPLMLLIGRAPAAREGALLAWLGGAGFFTAAMHWLVPNVGPFLLPVTIVIGALWLPWGWAAWLALRPPVTARRLLWGMAVVPAAWVAAEVVRSWDRIGGPWALLGTSQWQSRTTLALAAVGGVWLVSFLLVAANLAGAAVVSNVLVGRSPAPAAVAAVAVVALMAGGAAVRGSPPVAGSLRIAGVQPGVIRSVEPRFAASEAATRALGGEAPDLVVWGESSVGLDPLAQPEYLARIEDAARAAGADVLSGVDGRQGGAASGRDILKSALLVGPDGVRGRYDKMRLVPFGEYIPLRPVFGWVGGVSRAAAEDRRRGRELVLLDVDGVRVGPLVCFESAFPDMARRLAADGADLVVVQSATSTFQGSWAPEQHASLAAVRAVETGRPVVHATLTGVSAAFDAGGRRLVWFGTDRRGTWVATVPLSRGTTPYVRFGDWVPAGSLVVLLVAGTWGLGRSRRHRGNREEAGRVGAA